MCTISYSEYNHMNAESTVHAQPQPTWLHVQSEVIDKSGDYLLTVVANYSGMLHNANQLSSVDACVCVYVCMHVCTLYVCVCLL